MDRYLQQVRGFERWLEGRRSCLSQGAVRLMYVLLSQFDKAGFPDLFEIDGETLAIQCGCSRKTMLRYRDELVAQNLIELVDGAGSRPVGYRLMVFEDAGEVRESAVQPMRLDWVLAFWEMCGHSVSQYAEYHLAKLLRSLGPERLLRGMRELDKENRLDIKVLRNEAMWNGNFGKPGSYGLREDTVQGSGCGYDALIESDRGAAGEADGDRVVGSGSGV